MKRFTLLGLVASSLVLACGDGTLESIVTGAGGGGGTTSGPGGSGGSGGAPFDATGPALVYAHTAGVRLFVELQGFMPALPSDDGIFGLVAGTPVAVGRLGHDLLLMTEQGVGEVTLARFNDFALGGVPSVQTKTLALPPAGDSPQRGGSIAGDASGSLWVLTRATEGESGVWRNTLRWSPSGSIDGPWIVHEASPAIMQYVLLPDQSTIVADNGFSTFFLEVDREAEALTPFGGNTGLKSYRALEVFDGSLYAVSPNCSGDGDCSDTGELHIWRDLTAIHLPQPTVVISLPETSSHACSLTVNAQGLAVGTCAPPSGTPEPRLHVFRNPADLVSGAPADDTFVLEDDPVELVSYGWDDDLYDRSLSIFVRTPSAKLLAFEDAGEGAILTESSLATEPDQIGRDLLIVP